MLISIAALKQIKSEARTADDRRSICPSCCHRHAGRDRMGRPMNLFFKWLRRRDVSARPPASFAFCAVSFDRADPAALDAEWTAEILKRIASGKYFSDRVFDDDQAQS